MPRFFLQENEETMLDEPLLDPEKRQTVRKIRASTRWIAVSFLLTVVVLSFLYAILLARVPANEITLHCGNSTEEAKALGCEFDILSYTWTPKPCFDRVTADEFRQWLLRVDRVPRPWPFFVDKNATEWIPNEQVLSEHVDNLIWAPQEEHIGHCVFMMRRLHRINAGAVRINSRIEKYAHTEHCTNQILEELFSHKDLGRPAHFGISFATC